MCGLPQFVSTQVSSDIALWYCLSSGYLNLPTNKDTFRFHLFDIAHMVKINSLLGYPLHHNFERHYHRTLALFQLLDKYKRGTDARRKAMKTLTRGLHQKGFFVNCAALQQKFQKNEICTEFVPVDGSPDPEQVQEVKERLVRGGKLMRSDDLLFVTNLLD